MGDDALWRTICAAAESMAQRGLFVRDDFGKPDEHAVAELVRAVRAWLREWEPRHPGTDICKNGCAVRAWLREWEPSRRELGEIADAR